MRRTDEDVIGSPPLLLRLAEVRFGIWPELEIEPTLVSILPAHKKWTLKSVMKNRHHMPEPVVRKLTESIGCPSMEGQSPRRARPWSLLAGLPTVRACFRGMNGDDRQVDEGVRP